MPAPRGASADLNVWKPRVGMEEVTVAHVRTDGETGCYDLDCPGFVQESKTVTLGAEMTPVSTYGGKQHQFNVKIYKVSTNNSGCWKKFVYIS
ncbi:hypothetical protein LINPERPRIM_LOCUS26980 [Linum perenne]